MLPHIQPDSVPYGFMFDLSAVAMDSFDFCCGFMSDLIMIVIDLCLALQRLLWIHISHH